MRLPRRVIIDTDGGIDDAIAIALAVRSPEVRIVGVVTSYGNTDVCRATRNVTEVLERTAGRGIPVRAGAAAPITGPPSFAPASHGPTGLGHATVRPRSNRVQVPHALALLETLTAARPPITLVTLGPLTNLARALDANETLVRRTVRHHLGVFGALGAETRPADFNLRCDVEAAERVIAARLPSLALTIDATRQLLLPVDDVRTLVRERDALRRWLGDALRFSVDSHARRFRLSGCYVHDAVAIGAAVHPEIITIERRRIETDLDGNAGRPHRRETHSGTPMDVAIGVDARRMRHLLGRIFGAAWLKT